MILYLSYATSYEIFDELLKQQKIYNTYQVQRFNNSIIRGLAQYDEVVSLSALQYKGGAEKSIDKTIDFIRYVCVKHYPNLIHKFGNLLELLLYGSRLVRKESTPCIVVDAISLSPCIAAKLLGRLFHCPVVGIVTDIPAMIGNNKRKATKGIKRMQGFDGYILLTAQMNSLVNTKNKPYIVMEGVCPFEKVENRLIDKKKAIMYSGSLWKHDAGIENLVEGFLKADICDYELHFYGSGELVPWIETMAQTYPQIKYLGCVTNAEIRQRQQEAALLVNPRPSTEEFCKYSFPSKTLEYMASGTPVLMTRLPGVPNDYFKYVYTIDNETAEGVANALVSVFSNIDDIKRTGEAAQDFVSTNKNPTKQCKKIIDLVHSICEEF